MRKRYCDIGVTPAAARIGLPLTARESRRNPRERTADLRWMILRMEYLKSPPGSPSQNLRYGGVPAPILFGLRSSLASQLSFRRKNRQG